MAAFLPFAVLLSLLVTGATAGGGYGQSPTTPSTTPAPSTPKPSPPPPTPTPAPYTPTPAAPPPKPTPTPATPPPKPTPTTPYTPQPATPSPPPKPAHGGYDHDDEKKKKEVVVHVEGRVLCQSCAKKNTQSLDGAKPLPGAKVIVTCRDRKNSVDMEHRWGVVANSDGYFRADLGVQREDAYLGKDAGHGVCFVRLHSSPDAECNIFTNINYDDGMKQGAPLRDEGKQWTDGGIRHVVYAAGPLAFRPGPAKCAPRTNGY